MLGSDKGTGGVSAILKSCGNRTQRKGAVLDALDFLELWVVVVEEGVWGLLAGNKEEEEYLARLAGWEGGHQPNEC